MMKLFLVLQIAFLCHGSPASKPNAQDVTFQMDDLLQVANYHNMYLTQEVILVERNGNLEKYDTYSTGYIEVDYIEVAIKVTKNILGPKIQYLAGAGVMKINSGEMALEAVDFNVLGAEVSAHYSATGAGYSATLTLAGGKVSIFDLDLALGVSSEIGIIDDSVAVKVLGIGGSIGRVNKICVFDTCFGVDLGRLFG